MGAQTTRLGGWEGDAPSEAEPLGRMVGLRGCSRLPPPISQAMLTVPFACHSAQARKLVDDYFKKVGFRSATAQTDNFVSSTLRRQTRTLLRMCCYAYAVQWRWLETRGVGYDCITVPLLSTVTHRLPLINSPTASDLINSPTATDCAAQAAGLRLALRLPQWGSVCGWWVGAATS